MEHETGQVLEVAPELIQVLGGAVERDAAFHAYCAAFSHLAFLATELLRAQHVERGDTEHVCSAEQDARFVGARGYCGNPKRRKIHHVACNAGPHPARGFFTLAEY